MCSVGVGKGILEYHIKDIMPTQYLCCTDYTLKALTELKKFFLQCDEFLPLDLSSDISVLNKYDIVLMYRISTEFSFREWRRVFKKLYKNGTKHIIFVPTEIATVKDLINEYSIHFAHVLKGKKDTFCGWKYSENEFLKMMSGYYKVKSKKKFNDTTVFDLIV